MRDTSWLPKNGPLIQLNNKVRVIAPTHELGKEGIVVEVLEPLGELIIDTKCDLATAQ